MNLLRGGRGEDANVHLNRGTLRTCGNIGGIDRSLFRCRGRILCFLLFLFTSLWCLSKSYKRSLLQCILLPLYILNSIGCLILCIFFEWGETQRTINKPWAIMQDIKFPSLKLHRSIHKIGSWLLHPRWKNNGLLYDGFFCKVIHTKQSSPKWEG